MKLMKASRKNKKILMLGWSKKLKPSFSQGSNYLEDSGDNKLQDVP